MPIINARSIKSVNHNPIDGCFF